MPFSKTVASVARKPSGIATLQPSAYCDEWPDKPAKSVAVGLSVLSEGHILTCRAEAVKLANELHPGGDSRDPDWLEARNDALMTWALSYALCNPNNAAEPFLHMQDNDLIAQALRPEAIRHLWDELERTTIETSPVRSPASDEDLEELANLMRSGIIDKLVTPQAMRLRKLAAFMLDELVAVADLDLEEAG